MPTTPRNPDRTGDPNQGAESSSPTGGAEAGPASPGDSQRRARGSRFHAALDTFEHITDQEERTTQVLRLMPWILAFFIIACLAALLGTDMVSAHLHPGQIAKSEMLRWSLACAAFSSTTYVGAARIRAKRRRTAAQLPVRLSERAAQEPESQQEPNASVCARQTRQSPHRRRTHPIGSPTSRTRHHD